MLFLKKLLDFYIQSSIHVGIAVVSLLSITIFSTNLHFNIDYFICVFFGTIVGYNFLKYFELFQNGNFRNIKYYSILVLTIFASFGFLLSFLSLKNNIQFCILLSGILVLLYTLLRKHGWLKLFFVSFSVTFITVFIPYFSETWCSLECFINVLQRFIILISLLIPFEILDSTSDTILLQTIPQKFGVYKSKIFGILLIIPFFILEFFKQKVSILVLLIGIVVVLLIHFSSVNRNKYYTSFWVESVPIFWLFLLMVLK